MSASDIEWRVRAETEAALALLRGIANVERARVDGDPDLVLDSIEGETGLNEALNRALDEIDNCDVITVGCRAKEADFASRRAASEARAERLRALIEQTLVVLDIDAPMRLPGATLSLTKRPPKAIVETEASIPSEYWIEQPRPAPKLDTKKLLEALQSGTSVPGATLSNGGVTLTVRRK